MTKTPALSNTEAASINILLGIANHEYSFFDDGLTEGSGIWYDALRDETPVSKSLAGRAIARLVKDGHLTKDEHDTNEYWVALTAKGAKAVQEFSGTEARMTILGDDEAPAKSADATKAPRVRKPRPQHDCKCGCKLQTAGTYRPGHDAKHVSDLVALVRSAKNEKASKAAQVLASSVLSNRLFQKYLQQISR